MASYLIYEIFMNIAFDTLNVNLNGHSGNQTYTRELIKALCGLSTNDSWKLVTYWRKKQGCRKALGEHKQLDICNIYPNPKLLGKQLMFLITPVYPVLNRIIDKRCDLFHCTNPANFPFGIKNIVSTIHDLIALHEEPWVSDGSKSFYRKHIAGIIKHSRLLFADSDFTRNEIIQKFPEADHKTITVPLAASPKFQITKIERNFLRSYGITDPQKPYLLTVGEIQPRKNLPGTVRSFEAAAETDKDIQLIIIGQKRVDSFSSSILQNIRCSRFSKRIFILNNVNDDDLVSFYNNAIGFLYFSFYEGFGLPVIEAMQCGCPVCTSSTTSLKEIASGSALLASPYDQDSMNDCVKNLICNETLRRDLIQKGFKRAAQYSWKKTAEITYEGYKKALQAA